MSYKAETFHTVGFRSHHNISDNYALRGGGVHASGSAITLHMQFGNLQLTNNNTKCNGGMFSEVNSKLYVLKDQGKSFRPLSVIKFMGNQASYGNISVFLLAIENTHAPFFEMNLNIIFKIVELVQ